MRVEALGHKDRVFARDTEAEAVNFIEVCDVAFEALEDDSGALFRDAFTEHKDIFELAFLVATARPMESGEIDGVSDAEIMKRREHAAVDGFGEAQFRGDAAIEIRRDVFPIHALRCCREAEENLRLIVGKEFFVRTRRGVMHFIHDDVIVGVGRRVRCPIFGREGLDGEEEMFPLRFARRPFTSDEKAAKIFVAQNVSKTCAALGENFFAMRDEEQAVWARRFAAKAAIIERGEHGFARARGRDDEVFEIVMQEAFPRDIVKHLALVDERM